MKIVVLAVALFTAACATSPAPADPVGSNLPTAIPALGGDLGGLLTDAQVAPLHPLTMTNQTLTLTAPGAGDAGAVPATPAGYVTVILNGVSRQIPYF
jgi:hypothetical protein